MAEAQTMQQKYKSKTAQVRLISKPQKQVGKPLFKEKLVETQYRKTKTRNQQTKLKFQAKSISLEQIYKNDEVLYRKAT